jgi:hypothetical protein
MSEVNPSEQRYIIQETTHSDGSQTLLLRHSTPFSIKKRIVDRFNKKGYSATLYSDNRIEAFPTPEKLEQLKAVHRMEKL